MWNRKEFFVFLVVIILVAHLDIVRAADDDSGDDAPKSCYKYTKDFLKSSTTTLLKCIGEKFKPNELSDYVTRSWCILKCILKEMGTLTQDGKFDDIASAFFFEENFAPSVQEALLPSVQACFAYSELFVDTDYWCKTYEPFISCLLKALVAQMLPYSLNCYVGPGLSIVLGALKYIAPDPILESDANELRRRLSKPKPIHCYNQECTKLYKIEKSNGTSTFILMDKNMTELSRTLKKSKSGGV